MNQIDDSKSIRSAVVAIQSAVEAPSGDAFSDRSRLNHALLVIEMAECVTVADALSLLSIASLIADTLAGELVMSRGSEHASTALFVRDCINKANLFFQRHLGLSEPDGSAFEAAKPWH